MELDLTRWLHAATRMGLDTNLPGYLNPEEEGKKVALRAQQEKRDEDIVCLLQGGLFVIDYIEDPLLAQKQNRPIKSLKTFCYVPTVGRLGS
jgi:hypothetical protein